MMTTNASIPQQRTTDEKPKRVITTMVVVLRLDESIVRHKWRGDSEKEILSNIESEPLDEQIQEFVDEIQATAADDPNMIFTRTVKIVDPN